MKIKTAQIAEEIIRLMNENGMSRYEFAIKCDISHTTLKSILDGNTETTQRGVARKIAEGMNLELRIDTDGSIRFMAKHQVEENPPAFNHTAKDDGFGVTEEQYQLLRQLEGMNIKSREDLVRFMRRFFQRIGGMVFENIFGTTPDRDETNADKTINDIFKNINQ